MRHATAEGAQHSSPVCLLPSSHMLPISCIHSRMPSSPGSLSHSSPVRDPCHSLLTPHCTSIPALTPSPSSLSCPSEQAQCTGVQGIAQCEECGQRKEVALQTSEGSPRGSSGKPGTALSSAGLEKRWQVSRQSDQDGAVDLSCKKSDKSLDCS